jgi:hypothetical protein
LGVRILALDVKRPQLPKHDRVVIGRHRLGVHHPGIKIGIGHFDQALKIVEPGIVEGLDMRIGKAADDQIRLAHAAAPSPEQELAAPHVQPSTRPFRHHITKRQMPGRGRASGI